MDSNEIFIFGCLLILVVAVILWIVIPDPKENHVKKEDDTSSNLSDVKMSILAQNEEKRTERKIVFPHVAPPDSSYICTEVCGYFYRSQEAKNIMTIMSEGEELRLLREPENIHDRFAVRFVTLDGYHVGYINKEISEFICENMSSIIMCQAIEVPDFAEEAFYDIPQSFVAAIYFKKDVKFPYNILVHK